MQKKYFEISTYPNTGKMYMAISVFTIERREVYNGNTKNIWILNIIFQAHKGYM